jgi:hypothetical protein
MMGSTLVTAVLGIAAFAQPAIGRDYLAGHTTVAHAMYYAAAQGAWLVATAFTGAVLLAAVWSSSGTPPPGPARCPGLPGSAWHQ